MSKVSISLSDQMRRMAETTLDTLLDEADASGVSERTVDEIWAEAEQVYSAKLDKSVKR